MSARSIIPEPRKRIAEDQTLFFYALSQDEFALII
jgi:hypothetical protein